MRSARVKQVDLAKAEVKARRRARIVRAKEAIRIAAEIEAHEAETLRLKQALDLAKAELLQAEATKPKLRRVKAASKPADLVLVAAGEKQNAL